MQQAFKIAVLNHIRIRCILSQGYSLQFFLIFAHLWWFGGLGFGVGVMDRGLGVWLGYQLMGFGACGVGALYINIEE